MNKRASRRKVKNATRNFEVLSPTRPMLDPEKEAQNCLR
jgi:hypothetical protein